MNIKDISKGDKVFFGRPNGEKTLGEVVKVNRVKVKVKQLESRGTYKSYPIGTVWTVPVSLLSNVRINGIGDPEPEPVAKRPEPEILGEIRSIYSQLSPENLHCDGEASLTHVRRRGAQLRGQLRGCFRELGRKVSEGEAYGY